MSKMPQSFPPNLTCLAMPLQHGAVGDDIGFDLRLQRSNYVELLCYVVANESKACFSEEEKHGNSAFFLSSGRYRTAQCCLVTCPRFNTMQCYSATAKGFAIQNATDQDNPNILILMCLMAQLKKMHLN